MRLTALKLVANVEGFRWKTYQPFLLDEEWKEVKPPIGLGPCNKTRDYFIQSQLSQLQ